MAATPALVFDVSTIMRGTAHRPHGVLRVVFETALELLEATGGDIEFTCFDPHTRTYCEVGHQQLRDRIAVLTAVKDGHSSSVGRPSATRFSITNIARSSLRAAARVAPSTAQNLTRSLVHLRLSGRAFRAALRSITSDHRHWRARRRSMCHSTSWSNTTTYCTTGLDFAYNDLPYLQSRKLAGGFRVVMSVYDLIPLTAPQYTTSDLTAYFTDLVRVSDSVIVISGYTEHDLMTFVSQLALPRPQIIHLPLSSSLVECSPSRPHGLAAEVVETGFVAFVSSITARKNHHLLLDVWSRLLHERSPAGVPFLVLAGTMGSLSDETMSRIRRDASLRQRVLHLDGLADAEVAWLYRECAFTVYPSFYEGWGLPVSESLDFGKVCIASDRTSLPEAGEGLAIHLDPTDRSMWASTIVDLWTDQGLRERLEEQIVQRHTRVDGSETAARLLTALGLESSRPV